MKLEEAVEFVLEIARESVVNDPMIHSETVLQKEAVNTAEAFLLKIVPNGICIQALRLLAEIRAVGLTADQVHDLRVSMDCDTEFICDIMSHAEEAWELVKELERG